MVDAPSRAQQLLEEIASDAMANVRRERALGHRVSLHAAAKAACEARGRNTPGTIDNVHFALVQLVRQCWERRWHPSRTKPAETV